VSAVMMIVIGAWIAHRVDNRLLIGAGLLLSAYASSRMASLSLDADPFALIAPGIWLGFGMAFVFSQLSVITFETIAAEKSAEAAGLFNLMRTIGGSIGIAISSTLLVRREQVHWHYLGEHLTATNPRLQHWMDEAGLALEQPQAPVRLAAELFRHAQMGAFNDVFATIMLVFVALMPWVFLLRHRQARPTPSAVPAPRTKHPADGPPNN